MLLLSDEVACLAAVSGVEEVHEDESFDVALIIERGEASDHLECGDLSPLSPAAEPLSFLLSISPSLNVAVPLCPEGETNAAPPKGESGSATGESCDESQHSKWAASPLLKT